MPAIPTVAQAQRAGNHHRPHDPIADHAVLVAVILGPMTSTARRCPDISLAFGRCGFTAGHEVPHGCAEAQDGTLRCLRWDDQAQWLELPSDTGQMARVALPWAADYPFPQVGAT